MRVYSGKEIVKGIEKTRREEQPESIWQALGALVLCGLVVILIVAGAVMLGA